MKKYLLLFIGTAAVAAAVLGVGRVVSPPPVTVSLVTATEQTVRQTVDVSGRVEAAESTSVFAPLPCIAGEVFVTAGQTVSAGDPLFEVDAEATKAVLAGFGSAVSDDTLQQEVFAPVSGVISSIAVTQGGAVDPTVACAIIAGGDGIQVAAVIREKYLQQVAVGQAVEITGLGFSKEVYRGTVAAIADSAHQQLSGTASETVVDAVICFHSEDIDDSLRVGLNAKATIVVNTLENALLIPYDCITQTETGEEYVYVYESDGYATRTPITVAEELADGALVVSGVSAGARLARQPELLAGDRVACREG